MEHFTPEAIMGLCYTGVMLIGIVFVFATWHFSEPPKNKRKHTCAICGKKQADIGICHDCLDEGI